MSTAGDVPYPTNGLGVRVTELERRVTRIEDHDLPIENAVLRAEMKDMRSDLRDLKHATYAACVLLIAVLGVTIPIITG